MKYVLIITLILGSALSQTPSCPSGSFENNGKCEICMSNCANCENSASCLACSTGYMLISDNCYDECIPPRYPFLSPEGHISCNKISIQSDHDTGILLDHYVSTKEPISMYFENDYFGDWLEVNFWIRFEEFHEDFEETTFMIMSKNFVPYQIIRAFPYIFRLGLKGNLLTGPSEIVNIGLRMENQRWYMITVNFELVTYQNIFTGVIVYDFSNNQKKVFSASKSYPSALTANGKIVFHVGNFLNSSTPIFHIKNLRAYSFSNWKMPGMPVYDVTLQKFYDYEKNLSYENTNFEKEGHISIQINTEEIFRIHSINFYLDIETSTFPSTFFRILSGNKIVYSLDLVLHNDVVMLKRGNNLGAYNWKNFELNLIIIRTEENIIIHEEKNYIMIDPCPSLTLELHSSIYSTKFKHLRFVFAKDPSITNLLESNDHKIQLYSTIFLKRILTLLFVFLS